MSAPEDEEIRNAILQSVYNQRDDVWLTETDIEAQTVIPIDHIDIEQHLLILCDRKLLEKKSESTTVRSPFKIQGKSQRRVTQLLYRLTSMGERFVESGYSLPEKEPPRGRITVEGSPGAMVMINSPSGQQINYVSSPDLKGQINELKMIIAQMQDSQEKDNSIALTEALENECSKESPNRPLLAVILKTLEYLPALTGTVEAIKQILGI